MAELPEVETIRRQLAAEVSGRSWEDVLVKPSSLLRTPSRAVSERLKGARLEGVSRRGKVLLLEFGNGQVLLAHLGMTGQILLAPPAEPGVDHRHLTATLDDGRRLVFRDPRRLGFLKLAGKGELPGLKELSGIGPDPLDPALTWDKFQGEFKSRGGKVKSLLMDQRLFAGMGNIYADEILHGARVRPTRQASDLSPVELKDLYHGIRHVLGLAISHGGTSFDAAFVDIYGKPGLYGGCLKVYGRGKEPCLSCNTPLKLVRVGGRSSTFCPRCQR